jgi:hypothetical protein
MLGIEVLTECAMFSCEPVLLTAIRASGVMLTLEGATLGVQSLVALLLFLAKRVMDPSILPPAIISKGQGGHQQQSREGKDSKGDFLQVGIHEIAPSSIGKFAPNPGLGVW